MQPTNMEPVPTAVMWDESLLRYRFSDTHPMAPVRLELTHALAGHLGVLDAPTVTVLTPPMATDEQLSAVHDADYIQRVREASQLDADGEGLGAERLEEIGLGTDDCPVFSDLHSSSARIAGGSLAAAEALWSGDYQHVVNFAGGMHHAHREKASGFCIYNDAALAIQRMLDLGAERVAYVDLDAHHGDGVESIFWDDPRVLTVSLHETGVALFPGTGFANDIGGTGAEGSAVNVALPAGSNDAAYLRAVHAVVPQLLRAFSPDVLVTQHGCDGHGRDPLADLQLSVDGQRQLMLDARDWAYDYAGDRWLALGGGGYSPFDVVPRAWTHLIAIAAGHPVARAEPLPDAWLALASQRSGMDLDELPETMHDAVDVWWRSWEVGFDPADPTDQSVMATRKAVFPLHGLDPWFD
ncbi:acetoin utilization protein AcuC [Citricoccus muralis]|uniref:Acetoin utilization protein AcuC n=1 Tax=Citricoccus muralis TaxID=169134 RepID=A0ABY8H9W2_9MICC|nr:acetoin utilization protein AcuC [Citricoccus muralis]WFP17962.1 acetoin utilization protein AcuC [Citricoccus muralis]